MPSQSSYNVEVNQNPYEGTILVNPTTGVALETEFEIIVSNYFDEDTPLSYKFGFYYSLNDYLNEKSIGNTPTNSLINNIVDL